MKKFIQLSSAVLAMTLIASCASYQKQYQSTEKNWDKLQLPNKALTHQVFLIGDAGGDKQGKPVHTLKLIGQRLQAADNNSTAIFLGDNIYPHGLPPIGAKGRIIAEKNLKGQLDILKNFAGKTYFVPGNHDWEAIDGVAGVRRQETFIQQYLDRGDTFIPDNGCSGPEVKQLSKNTTLIAIDSQWYLENWDGDAAINSGCKIRTREIFLRELADKIKDNREKNIILAMHHPLNSNGRHGGHFSFKEHLFPLTIINSKLWVPLPGIGSLLAVFSKNIARPQELAHPNYKAFKRDLLEIAEKFTNVIFVSGHEHSLQYFEEANQHFIVSGSGSRQTPVGLGKDAQFVAGVEGFANLNIYEDGEVWVDFWATTTRKREMLTKPKLIFRKKVRPPLPSKKELIPTCFLEYEQLKKQGTIIRSVIAKEELPIFNQTFWGQLHTDEYITPFEIPVLDLAVAKGGLTAFGKGGGNQSNSIRLKSKEGKIYQLRTVRKVTERFPSKVRKTMANQLVKQQLTAGHPFSALVVGKMAAAIGVYHTNPQIVYVPQQPNLGIYNELAGEVFLFEERAAGDWADLVSFGHPDEIKSTDKLIHKMLKGSKVKIDQQQVLRSRLFDNILGDWDRHEDQWRWAGFKSPNGEKIYQPIPRDRDQAYANFDGIANELASYTVPFTRAAHKYDGDISKKEETWLNYQARIFDRLFLNQLTLSEWEETAKYIQAHLTDATIEEGIQQLPSFSYQKKGKQWIEWTKDRRDNLLQTARNYYQILNKEVQILGTHEQNYFQIHRLNDLQTKVVVYQLKKGKKRQLFERTFENRVTKELQLYGLDGADHFQIIGKATKGPIIRLIGGKGKDTFVDKSEVKGMDKRTKIYDDIGTDNRLKLKNESKDYRSNRNDLNAFNHRDFNYNYTIPMPILGSNPDDGMIVGLSLNRNTYSFKRQQTHQIIGNYAIGSNSLSFQYEGNYFKTFNHWDTYLKISAEMPRFVTNFHGLGNETIRDIDQFSRDYYRVQRSMISIYSAIKRRWSGGATFTVGPVIESMKIEQNIGRITNDDYFKINPIVFKDRWFAGGNVRFDFTNADNIAVPTDGLHFTLGASWRTNLHDFDRQTLRLDSELKFYVPLTDNHQVVLGNSIGGQHLLGSYDFFQAITLGGNQHLRGFANERFSGRTAFYHNIDLRIQLIDSKNKVLPFSAGITPIFDYGRVWINGESSNKIHYNYGANLWIAPLNSIALSAGLFYSEEETRFMIKGGFEF